MNIANHPIRVLPVAILLGCTSGHGRTPTVTRDATVLAPMDGALSLDAADAALADASKIESDTDARTDERDVADGSLPTDAATMPGRDAAQATDASQRMDASVAEEGDDWQAICTDSPPLTSPVPSGATATLIQGGFNFLEGPVWIADGAYLLFSDMGAGGSSGDNWPVTTVFQLKAGVAAPTPWLEMANSNGLALTPAGALLACTHDRQTLSVFDLDSKVRQVLDIDHNGNRFNSPNDVTVGEDGSFYFTDPDWQLGNRPSQTKITGVYRVAPGGQVNLIDGTLNKPNGITLSLDGKTLYVSAYDSRIHRYDVAADGSVSASGHSIFVEDSSDGMAVDCAGNLYLTGDGVRIYNPAGTLLGRVDVPETTSNVAFGGADRKTLYITAGHGLYAMDVAIAGSPY